MRLTITKSNQSYLKTLAQAWALSEKEALNYLLNKLRIEGLTQPVVTETAINQATDYQQTAPEEFVEEDEVVKKFALLIEEF